MGPMSVEKLKLTRNLRRDVLRGHPWLYREAFESLPQIPASLVKVFDKKNQFLCWGLFDPTSPLAVRVLSLSDDFSQKTLDKKFRDAMALRSQFPSKTTTAFRLINGEGDFLPGLVCDIYGKVAVIQYDGDGCGEFWPTFPIRRMISEVPYVESVFIKGRGKTGKLKQVVGNLGEGFPLILENGLTFKVDIETGQKTGFFLDQRDNRRYLASQAKDKAVLNCFSYTGGFSISAGRGGAKHVISADISQKAMDMADENWVLNKLPKDGHKTRTCDVYDFLQTTKEKWDLVIVDPPSMAKSEDQKASAVTKYTHLFANAAKATKPGGDLMLSSCSSHIDFSTFYEICVEALSHARRMGQVVRISGQGKDHPFPLACPEMRYLKFFHIKVFK